MTPEVEAKFRESVRLLAGTENLQWTNDAMATVLDALDAARAENARLRAALEATILPLHYGGGKTHRSVLPGDLIATCLDEPCPTIRAALKGT